MAAAKKQQLTVAGGRVVVIDGVSYKAGDTVSVSATDAKVLLESGDLTKS